MLDPKFSTDNIHCDDCAATLMTMVIEKTQRDVPANFIPDKFKDFSERRRNYSNLVETDLWDPTMVKIIGDELEFFKKFRSLLPNTKAEGNEVNEIFSTSDDWEHSKYTNTPDATKS